MDKVKVGVFGGRRGYTFICNALDDPHVELVAICDRDEEVLEKWCRENAEAKGFYNIAYYKDFEDFITFAKTQEFDYRSSAKTYYDSMKKELEKDGLADAMKDELAAMEKALEMDKERFIRLKKDEIIPFIEEEVATRYWYQEAGVKVRLRYDEQLKKALNAY